MFVFHACQFRAGHHNLNAAQDLPVQGIQLRQRRIEPVHDGRVNNDHIRVQFYHGCDTNQGERGIKTGPKRGQTNLMDSRISESSTLARIWCRSEKRVLGIRAKNNTASVR